VKLTIQFHLVSRLMRGAIPPLPIRLNDAMLEKPRGQLYIILTTCEFLSCRYSYDFFGEWVFVRYLPFVPMKHNNLKTTTKQLTTWSRVLLEKLIVRSAS
jgi:hypothetical protein